MKEWSYKERMPSVILVGKCRAMVSHAIVVCRKRLT